MATLEISGAFRSLRSQLADFFEDADLVYRLGSLTDADPFFDDLTYYLTVADETTDPIEYYHVMSFDGTFFELTIDEQSGFVDEITFQNFDPPSLIPTDEFRITGLVVASGLLYDALNADAGPLSDGGETYSALDYRIDDVIGSAGDDIVHSEFGSNGTEYLLRGGDDTFRYSRDDRVVVSGGTGFDVLQITQGGSLTLAPDVRSSGLAVKLDGEWGESTFTAFEGFEKLNGSLIFEGTSRGDVVRSGAGKDRLSGEAGGDILFSGANADKIFGGKGNDQLGPGRGNDMVFGGAGIDTITYADLQGVGASQINLVSGKASGGQIGTDTFSSIENVVGSGGNDRIVGTQAANRLDGGRGNDTIISKDGSDRLFGGRGDDNLVATRNDDQLFGGTGSDEMSGGRGNDRLDGAEGADALFGGRGNDFLFGSFGNDTLVGSEGADRIIGGTGGDRLIGGAQRDTFVFNEWSGRDLVKDFQIGFDRIELVGALSDMSLAQVIDTAVGGVGFVRLELSASATVVLRDVTLDQLDELTLV